MRAGVVKHPEDWPFGGYRYILAPPKRYRLTNNKKLMELMNIREIDRLRETYRNWVDSAYAGRYQKTAAVDGKHRRRRRGLCGKSERSDGLKSDGTQSC